MITISAAQRGFTNWRTGQTKDFDWKAKPQGLSKSAHIRQLQAFRTTKSENTLIQKIIKDNAGMSRLAYDLEKELVQLHDYLGSDVFKSLARQPNSLGQNAAGVFQNLLGGSVQTDSKNKIILLLGITDDNTSSEPVRTPVQKDPRQGWICVEDIQFVDSGELFHVSKNSSSVPKATSSSLECGVSYDYLSPSLLAYHVDRYGDHTPAENVREKSDDSTYEVPGKSERRGSFDYISPSLNVYHVDRNGNETPL